MPTLVIENVPAPLFDRIQQLAQRRQQAPGDMVLEVLETALRQSTPVHAQAPLPQEPSLTQDAVAPCSIPRPQGKAARSVRVPAPLPSAHDQLDAE